MDIQLNKLLEDIKTDYVDWSAKANITRQEMLEEFKSRVRYTEGNKYIKVIQGTSVWGFIVKEDGVKFRKGDILLAAGWNNPATNKARGNILDGGYTIRWTGPLYL